MWSKVKGLLHVM